MGVLIPFKTPRNEHHMPKQTRKNHVNRWKIVSESFWWIYANEIKWSFVVFAVSGHGDESHVIYMLHWNCEHFKIVQDAFDTGCWLVALLKIVNCCWGHSHLYKSPCKHSRCAVRVCISHLFVYHIVSAATIHVDKF